MNERSGDGNGPKVPRGPAKVSIWEKLQDQINPRPPDDDEPQDWWFASTAIPLIAATTSPFANVMSVVALAMSWKSEIHPEQQDPEGNPVQVLLADPRWYNPVLTGDLVHTNYVRCIGLNATSLAFGVLGNLFLLFNFTRTIRYIIALPASIILWLLATAIVSTKTITPPTMANAHSWSESPAQYTSMPARYLQTRPTRRHTGMR